MLTIEERLEVFSRPRALYIVGHIHLSPINDGLIPTAVDRRSTRLFAHSFFSLSLQDVTNANRNVAAGKSGKNAVAVKRTTGVKTRSMSLERAGNAASARQASAMDDRETAPTERENKYVRTAVMRADPTSYQVTGNKDDIDERDHEDPLCATAYVEDMYQTFREKEAHTSVRPVYMEQQKHINERMRAILVDWLVEVHLKFKLVPETLYLTINLIDRYLELQEVSRPKLQLVGVTCLLIASKYEEIYPPELRDLVYICDRAYTRQDVSVDCSSLSLVKTTLLILSLSLYRLLRWKRRFSRSSSTT